MTTQSLENTTTIQNENETERAVLNALFDELGAFKARTLKVTIISAILFGVLAGCAIMAWQSYQGLFSGIDIANIAIDIPRDIPRGVFKMQYREVSNLPVSAITKGLMWISLLGVIIGGTSIIFNIIRGSVPVAQVVTLGFFALIAAYSAGFGAFDSANKPELSKNEIIKQLKSDDYNDFQQALSYIKNRDIDLAKYLEIQHRVKKGLNISDEDRDFIETKIVNKSKGFENIPNSSAYLFSQAVDNQSLSDMANTYKQEYYQEKKSQLIQYLIASSILSFFLCLAILANCTMRKRLKRIDFVAKSMLRME